jgi:hypothetical protein
MRDLAACHWSYGVVHGGFDLCRGGIKSPVWLETKGISVGSFAFVGVGAGSEGLWELRLSVPLIKDEDEAMKAGRCGDMALFKGRRGGLMRCED